MKRTLKHYHVILAHGGRRDDVIIETVEATSAKAYAALCDRIFAMNSAITAAERATKTYYGIRAAQ